MLKALATTVRTWMLVPAKALHTSSGGRITPNFITFVSLTGHILVVWALCTNRLLLAAVSLIFFGLMDSLDGALARIQNSSTLQGMFNDAVSDRAKEVLLYSGLTYYVLHFTQNTGVAWLPTAVLGMSLLVSYTKAKGEMAVAGLKKSDPQLLNRAFADGIARYEVRMAVVIIGLIFSAVVTSLWILLGLVCITALQRYIRIQKVLQNV